MSAPDEERGRRGSGDLGQETPRFYTVTLPRAGWQALLELADAYPQSLLDDCRLHIRAALLAGAHLEQRQ